MESIRIDVRKVLDKGSLSYALIDWARSDRDDAFVLTITDHRSSIMLEGRKRSCRVSYLKAGNRWTRWTTDYVYHRKGGGISASLRTPNGGRLKSIRLVEYS